MVARTSRALVLVSILPLIGVCRCGAEPRFTAARGDEVDAGRDDPVPSARVPVEAAQRSAPAGFHAPRRAFALDTRGAVAAFDPDSGAELASYPCSGVVTDLCWDAARERVVFAESDGWADGARVYALRFDGAFVLNAASDGLPGSARLACTKAGVLAIGEDERVGWWSLLDAALTRVGQAAALSVPASLVVPASHFVAAFAPRQWRAGAYRDVLFAVDDPGGTWTTTSSLVEPDSDVVTRLVGAGADEAWLVRRPRKRGTLRLAAVDLAALSAAPLGAAGDVEAGELADALYEPSQRALVLLSESDGGATIDVVPTGPRGSAPHRHFLSHAQASPAWHTLALDAETGRVLVATASGIVALSPSGSPVAAFDGRALRPPVIVP